MVCVNCVAAWCQSYLPALVLPVALWLANSWRISSSSSSSFSSAPTPPVYGPWYLPAFVRGILAAIRLGADEDAFLLGLAEVGPLVYLPWPLGQYMATGEAVQRVYDTPKATLSFIPIRRSMATTVFGSSVRVSTSKEIESRLFPVHSRGLTRGRLEEPMTRFASTVQERLDLLEQEISQGENASIELGLTDLVEDIMFDAATNALFGPSLVPHTGLSLRELRTLFSTFDSGFPLAASELVPPFLQSCVPPLAKANRAREQLALLFMSWIDDGLPGMEAGVIKEMAETSLASGWGSKEAAYILTSDLWALQANAPYIASALILNILQSGQLLNEIRAEVDALPPALSPSGLPDALPISQSCITETLRLSTSSFSIRVAEEDFVFACPASDRARKGEQLDARFSLPKGARVVCATRVTHLSEDLWDGNARAFDGNRFYSGAGDDRGARVKHIRAFGGGISMCEGRHLATLELLTVISQLLSRFDITDLHSPSLGRADATCSMDLRTAGGTVGLRPKVAQGRVGLGAFQFVKNDLTATLRLRGA